MKRNPNHGEQSEEILKDICNRVFGEMFVAKNPKIKEKSGDKELTDVLVNLDSETILIQSKSIQLDTTDLDTIKTGRVLRKIDKAKIQMNTALNAEKRKTEVEYTNGIGIKETIDWKSIKNKHGIITLNIEDLNYENPEYRFQVPWFVEKHKDIYIHYFILRDLHLISHEYDTPWDFINYLEYRKRINETIPEVAIRNELDFAAMIRVRYKEFEKAIQQKIAFFAIKPGLWEEYIKMEKTNRLKKINKYDSIAIDNLIRLIHREINLPNGFCQSREDFQDYKQIASLLSKLSRAVRRDFTRKIREKYENTKERDMSHFSLIFEEVMFLVVFANESNRTKRINILDNLCFVASKKVLSSNYKASLIVGVSYTGAKEKKSGEVIFLLEKIEQAREEELPKKWENLFEEFEIQDSQYWDE